MTELRLAPPPRPRLEEDRRLLKTIQWSLGFHLLFVLFITIQGFFFSSPIKPYIPTLRVDLVGLPDQLKTDKIKAPSDSTKIETSKKSADPPLPESDPQSMKFPKKNAAKNGVRLKSALDRIKALDKVASTPDEKEVPLKGNKISKGTSLSDDAKESIEAHYFDLVRDRLQSNWALPIWLARQNLSARAQIYLDASGRLRSFKIVKSSGNYAFDDAVKRAITESSPFSKPAEEITSNLLYDGILVGFPL